MHIPVRVNDIKPLDENNRLYEVDSTLTNGDEKDFRRLTDRTREETYPEEEGWHHLVKLQVSMGQSRKDQKV